MGRGIRGAIGAVAVAGLLGALTQTAWAEDDGVFAGLEPMSETEMSGQRAKNASINLPDSEILQMNNTSQTSTNDNASIANSGSMQNGRIGANSFERNRGNFTVMQNSGNQVNMNSAMSVNIHLQ